MIYLRANLFSMFRLLIILLTIEITQCLYAGAGAADSSMPLKGEVTITQPAEEISQPNTNENIGQQQQNLSIWAVELNAYKISGDEAHRLAKEGILIGDDSEDNYINLEGGNVLINPEKDLLVGIGAGKILVRAGATVFISKNGDDTVIYDLLQTKPNPVSVTLLATKQKIDLAPTHMLVLTKQETDNFDSLQIDCHRIDYKHVVSLTLSNDNNDTLKVFKGNFSVASAMATIEPFRTSIKSPNKQDQIVMGRLLNGTALLEQLANSQ